MFVGIFIVILISHKIKEKKKLKCGKNIIEIIFNLQKLEELEREEALREQAGFYDIPKIELDERMKEIQEIAAKIRERKAIMKIDAQLVKNSTKPVVPRTTTSKVRSRSVSRLRTEMSNLGVNIDETDKVTLLP